MSDVPRPEYPRPQFVRRPAEGGDWVNLNGEWQFGLDPGQSGDTQGWTSGHELPERIIVPFAPESKLSGLGWKDFMTCVWYRRTFDLEKGQGGGRMLLHFGAVDYEATVWVNGRRVGWHRGGYTPFTCDITAAVQQGQNEVVVQVFDDVRSGLQPVGKQSRQYESHGCLYTRTTGIWQTVWLEPVPESYLTGLRLTPDLAGECLWVEGCVVGPTQRLKVSAAALAGERAVGRAECAAASSFRLVVPLGEVKPWSPASPLLYDLKLRLESGSGTVDALDSYFGLRDLSIEGPALGLNGEPLFERLVLDQGYYPDGIYTAPSDEALKRDVEISLGLGFNGARLHEKVFEPRFLYWADRLGYLCWGEFPNWGLDHARPEALGRMLPEWLEAVARDYSHPCIVGWCPFNETPANQAPELIRGIYRATKAADRSRPVLDTSGYHHVETDVYDCHNYEQDVEKFAAAYRPLAEGGEAWRNDPDHNPPHAGQPYFVSEYGGTWWNPEQAGEAAWGYGARPRTEEEFIARYRGLTETLLFHPRMCGFCYTQLYDIEQEVNGLYTYGRKPKFDPQIFHAINTQKAAIEQ